MDPKKREAGGPEVQKERLEDATLVTSKMEEWTKSQGIQEASWRGKRQGNRCFPRDPRKNTTVIVDLGLLTLQNCR